MFICGRNDHGRGAMPRSRLPTTSLDGPGRASGKVRNASTTEDLLFYVVANEDAADVCTKHRP
jgi:hypothetical protein